MGFVIFQQISNGRWARDEIWLLKIDGGLVIRPGKVFQVAKGLCS